MGLSQGIDSGQGMTQNHPAIGIIGGTFDPIHIGHLGLAKSAKAALGLTSLCFLPTGNPWQKAHAVTPAEHRLAMLRIALAGWPNVVIDTQEMDRSQQQPAAPSYTIESLVHMRGRVGAQASLVLVIGSDQLQRFNTWHRWQEILSFCHLAVTQRERVPLTDLPEAVEALVNQRGAQRLPNEPCGSIVLFSMPPMPVSSTAVRKSLRNHEDVSGLVPDAVLNYINQHSLYQ